VAAEVINLIFGVWLADTLQLQIAGLGLASLVIGLSQLSGEGLVTWFTDRLGKPRALQIGLVLNSLAAFSLLLLGKSVAGALAALFLFYITSEFSMVSAIPLMTEVLPEARTTYIATYIAFQSIGRAGGALLALPLYHWGLMGNILTALVFNLLALAALSVLQRYLKGV
jgi:predicted MFS family arabinose efflux permease